MQVGGVGCIVAISDGRVYPPCANGHGRVGDAIVAMVGEGHNSRYKLDIWYLAINAGAIWNKHPSFDFRPRRGSDEWNYPSLRRERFIFMMNDVFSYYME